MWGLFVVVLNVLVSLWYQISGRAKSEGRHRGMGHYLYKLWPLGHGYCSDMWYRRRASPLRGVLGYRELVDFFHGEFLCNLHMPATLMLSKIWFLKCEQCTEFKSTNNTARTHNGVLGDYAQSHFGSTGHVARETQPLDVKAALFTCLSYFFSAGSSQITKIPKIGGTTCFTNFQEASPYLWPPIA